jgi:hypothetical protein
MRKLTIGTDKYTSVFAIDEKGEGNANHLYIIEDHSESTLPLCNIKFQNFVQQLKH